MGAQVAVKQFLQFPPLGHVSTLALAMSLIGA